MFNRFSEILRGSIRLLKVSVYLTVTDISLSHPQWKGQRSNCSLCAWKESFDLKNWGTLPLLPLQWVRLVASHIGTSRVCTTSASFFRRVCFSLSSVIQVRNSKAQSNFEYIHSMTKAAARENHCVLGAENMLSSGVLPSWVPLFGVIMPMTTLE